MAEILDYTIVSIILLAIGIYGLTVKRNFIRMLFAVEIIINAANLNLVAFSRLMPVPNSTGQTFALFSIAIAAAEVAVGLALIIVAYRIYRNIDIKGLKRLSG
ncbi:MAG: NADH-quinone oxidoreductase subunit NuoK [Candidatus Nitrosocaldus sp.]|nr:NADH-quinone oxidoreductase subunit K [archaeon HR04]